MTARAWDDSLLEQHEYAELLDVADDPSWDDATELLWDEHLARQEARVELAEEQRGVEAA